MERYKRQIILEEFGEESQKKLLNSRVLICGAGGLGCPALLYFAAAGIGTIGIADFDKVEITNLQRQTLYNENDLGKLKVEAAKENLGKLNSNIKINTYNTSINNKNAVEIISNYDIVVDGTDNFETRYILNDTCVLLDKPLVYGAVLKFEGQVGVFNLQTKNNNFKTNYRDLFHTPPDPKKNPTCNDAGILGVLPGIIGTLQATETIKIITGIGEPLANQILSFNALSNSFYKVNLAKSEKNGVPVNIEDFKNYDYSLFCNSKTNENEIEISQFKKLLKTEKLTIVDIREYGEKPDTTDFSYKKIPMSQLYENLNYFICDDKLIIFCQTGKRSLNVAEILKDELPGQSIYSLKGGIVEWEKNKLLKK
ncbi:MAG: molybdopterin-synthase adenylyltransferase MoeB [Bacteroidetes bacterium]|nr:molybdopterin-synthase adenylyltransferase MoeB [Bacteroidota bacterium]